MPLQLTLIRVKMAYSQCDHASPCSSCFFLLRASTRRRSEHSSQMVISDGSPHTLQTWRACSGRRSDCSRGTSFMFASRCTEAAAGQAALLVTLLYSSLHKECNSLTCHR